FVPSLRAGGRPAPAPPTEATPPGCAARHYLPGKILEKYYGYGDNEGILSTIPAVATALLGALAGQWLRAGRSAAVTLLGLTLAGVVCLLLGATWGGWLAVFKNLGTRSLVADPVKSPGAWMEFPVIKNLWTSSFVLVAGGWSLLLLAFFHGVIDVLGFRRWAFFFTVIGANAITIYVVPRFIDFPKVARFFLGGLIRHSGSFAPVALAAGVLAAGGLVLLFLFRRRLFPPASGGGR